MCTTTTADVPNAGETPRLKWVLGLRDLIVYGLIIIQIIAPIPIFALIQQRSNGHAVTAAFWSHYLKLDETHQRRFIQDALLSMGGFLCCLIIWLGLPNLSKLVGGSWLLAGTLYCGTKTRGFCERPILFDFNEN